jgi:hypothetical protein
MRELLNCAKFLVAPVCSVFDGSGSVAPALYVQLKSDASS